MSLDRLLAALADDRPAMMDALREFLRFPSISNRPPDAGCGPCADWLALQLAELDFGVEVLSTPGQPAVLAERPAPHGAPSLLVYGHYDVQPPEPLELWDTDPFDPQVRDGRLHGRGTSDDKGQVFLYLAAVRAFRAAGVDLPVGLTLLIEGEEEIGSPNVEPLLADHADRLAADGLLISDSTFYDDRTPALTDSLRGLCAFELTVTGPGRDLHSGLEGGLVANPAEGLARLLASMRDPDGRIAIANLYDDVRPVDPADRDAWRRLHFDASEHARQIGLDCLAGGERDLHPLERNWARPTLDTNGLTAGYQGDGPKTVIPASASAKITMRLVADQDPQAVADALSRHVASHTPPGCRAELAVQSLGRPVRLTRCSPVARTAESALAAAFGQAPVWVGCGASIPITEIFQRVLGLDAVLLGFGLPGDRIHAPNEHIALDQLDRGAETLVRFLLDFPNAV
jgi:acetylornithine deacetylase/succinyl-diaminopimelate desuccinylase-like protein